MLGNVQKKFNFSEKNAIQNLIDYFGPTVEMKLTGMEKKFILNDTAFPEQLKLLIPESKSGYYDHILADFK